MSESVVFDSRLGRLVPEAVRNTEMTSWLGRENICHEKGSTLKMLASAR